MDIFFIVWLCAIGANILYLAFLLFGSRLKSFWLRNIVLRKSNRDTLKEEHAEEETLKKNSLVSEPLSQVYYCEPNPAPPVSRYDLPALKQFKFRQADELTQTQTQICEPISFLVGLSPSIASQSEGTIVDTQERAIIKVYHSDGTAQVLAPAKLSLP